MNRIRISCACLCRIEHAGRLLLLLNANRRAKGKYELSPIGGGLRVDDLTLLNHIGAELEEPELQDLRLTLPLGMLNVFSQWFYTGRDRERSPFRELYEELVVENTFLPDLTPEHVEWRYLRTIEEEMPTTRVGYTGMFTKYFLEIYEVRFTNWATLGALLALKPESGAAWVPVEIAANRDATLTLKVDGEEREAHVNGYLLTPPDGNNGP